MGCIFQTGSGRDFRGLLLNAILYIPVTLKQPWTQYHWWSASVQLLRLISTIQGVQNANGLNRQKLGLNHSVLKSIHYINFCSIGRLTCANRLVCKTFTKLYFRSIICHSWHNCQWLSVNCWLNQTVSTLFSLFELCYLNFVHGCLQRFLLHSVITFVVKLRLCFAYMYRRAECCENWWRKWANITFALLASTTTISVATMPATMASATTMLATTTLVHCRQPSPS